MKKFIALIIALVTVAAVCAGAVITAAVLPGDTDGDGEVNNKDVVTLFRYVSAGKKAEDESIYDYNNDNEVNNKDVVALFRAVSSGQTPDTTDTAAADTTETETEPTVTETDTEPTDTETKPADTEDEGGEEFECIKIGGVPLDEFAVVIAADPLSGVKNAAADMIRLIEFSEGISLPLVNDATKTPHAIILGETARDTEKIITARKDVKDDGYALIEDGGNLYISGIIARGTANGVYDFLQNYLGVRFYSDTFTYVREDGINDVPANQKTIYNPTLPGRYNWSFAAEQKIQRFTNRTKSTSIKYGGSHNLGSLSKTGDGVSAQPCLSDPAIFDQVFASLCKQIEKNPAKTLFHINQNDGGKFCTCADCTAKNEAAGGTCMGSLLMFINDIADAVKEKYPDRQIDIMTYAYHDTTTAPDPSVVKPRDNVVIVLCRMDSSCFNHAWDDPNCKDNKASYANMVNWSNMCKKFAVYDYSYNHASSVTSVGPNLDVLWDNMQALKKCGCIGLLTEGDHVAETGEFVELRNYLINSLMWDPDMTKEEYYELWDEFMNDYYGKAAPYIREYIDLMNATSLRAGLTDWNGHTSVYTDPSVFYAPKVNGSNDYTVINKCIELWDAALACELTDEQFAHVEKSSLHFRDFESRYAENSTTRVRAALKFQALCDKYTYDYDKDLPERGSTEWISKEKPSEDLLFRQYPDKDELYVCDVGNFEEGVLVIPTENDGKKVTSVGKSAFSRATSVVELYVPEGITYIGVYAFRGCANLETVHLPASLTTLGYGALGVAGSEHYECASLTDIYYAGTAGMWHKIYDRSNGDWKTLAGVTVHCSDTDIVIKAAE
ncbi:MAG: DUF4838 domain-containing protein [Clostridia bacterium]|nr:DUF4838 domain-containing protein [Clostridia bacterium]